MSVYRGLVFYGPLYLAVNCTVLGVRLSSTGLWNILGDDFLYGFRIQRFLGSTVDTCSASVQGGFMVISHFLLLVC